MLRRREYFIFSVLKLNMFLVPKRGLSEMASLLDAMESKLKDDPILPSIDGNANDEVYINFLNTFNNYFIFIYNKY